MFLFLFKPSPCDDTNRGHPPNPLPVPPTLCTMPPRPLPSPTAITPPTTSRHCTGEGKPGPETRARPPASDVTSVSEPLLIRLVPCFLPGNLRQHLLVEVLGVAGGTPKSHGYRKWWGGGGGRGRQNPRRNVLMSGTPSSLGRDAPDVLAQSLAPPRLDHEVPRQRHRRRRLQRVQHHVAV